LNSEAVQISTIFCFSESYWSLPQQKMGHCSCAHLAFPK
jgi:hypothetical protein